MDTKSIESRLIITIVFTIFLVINCFAGNIRSEFNVEIEVDGNYSDWGDKTLTYLHNDNMSLGFAHDKKFIYVLMKTEDVNIARQVARMGITVWLDKQNEQTKINGMRYVGNQAYFDQLQKDGQNRKNFKEREPREDSFIKNAIKEELPEAGHILLINNGESSKIKESGAISHSAGCDEKDGVYSYEFKMPLPMSAMLTNQVNVGVEIGGISEENKAAIQNEIMNKRKEMEGRRPMGGRAEGRMQRSPGDRMGRERPDSNGMEKRPPEFDKKEFWFDIELEMPKRER